MNVAARVDLYTIFGSMGRFLRTLVPLAVIVGVVTNIAATAGIIESALISGAIVVANQQERPGWESFKASLPLSRGQIVAGYYLAVLAFSALILGVSIVSCYLSWALKGVLVAWAPSGVLGLDFGSAQAQAAPLDVLLIALMTFVALLLVTALLLPFLLRYGSTGAFRWLVLLGCGAAICVGIFFAEPLDVAAPVIGGLNEWMILLLSCAVTALAWAVSYVTAKQLYLRKAF